MTCWGSLQVCPEFLSCLLCSLIFGSYSFSCSMSPEYVSSLLGVEIPYLRFIFDTQTSLSIQDIYNPLLQSPLLVPNPRTATITLPLGQPETLVGGLDTPSSPVYLTLVCLSFHHNHLPAVSTASVPEACLTALRPTKLSPSPELHLPSSVVKHTILKCRYPLSHSLEFRTRPLLWNTRVFFEHLAWSSFHFSLWAFSPVTTHWPRPLVCANPCSALSTLECLLHSFFLDFSPHTPWLVSLILLCF